jgi:hypothetical protein
MTTLTFIHTVPSLRPTFEALAHDADPSLEIRHVTDESLLADAIEAGSVPEETQERLTKRIRSALDDGADLVVVTCSSMGGATEAIARREGWPLERIDVAMADRAIDPGAGSRCSPRSRPRWRRRLPWWRLARRSAVSPSRSCAAWRAGRSRRSRPATARGTTSSSGRRSAASSAAST